MLYISSHCWGFFKHIFCWCRTSCLSHQKKQKMGRTLQVRSLNCSSATWSVFSTAFISWARSCQTSSLTKWMLSVSKISRSGDEATHRKYRTKLIKFSSVTASVIPWATNVTIFILNISFYQQVTVLCQRPAGLHQTAACRSSRKNRRCSEDRRGDAHFDITFSYLVWLCKERCWGSWMVKIIFCSLSCLEK